MKKIKTVDIATVALCSALMCVCSLIQIPSAIPFTLQTFAVFFVSITFGLKKALISTVIYILLGAVGLPVFSGFQGGIGVLTGATGGFILSFIPAAVTISLISHKAGKSFLASSLSCIPGLLLCYASGIIWYSFIFGGGSIKSAFFVCVLPFIVPDILKILLAVTVSKRIQPLINR